MASFNMLTTTNMEKYIMDKACIFDLHCGQDSIEGKFYYGFYDG